MAGVLRQQPRCNEIRPQTSGGEILSPNIIRHAIMSPQVKRNVELELEAVHALQAQGVPIRHGNDDGNDDGNASGDEVDSDAALVTILQFDPLHPSEYLVIQTQVNLLRPVHTFRGKRNLHF